MDKISVGFHSETQQSSHSLPIWIREHLLSIEKKVPCLCIIVLIDTGGLSAVLLSSQNTQRSSLRPSPGYTLTLTVNTQYS